MARLPSLGGVSAPPSYTPESDRTAREGSGSVAAPLPSGARPWARALAALVALVASVVVVAAASHFNQTFDEPAHLAAGMQWLVQGRYDIDPQHPPLARVAMALGPRLAGATTQAGRNMWEEGNEILLAGGHYGRTLTLARLGVLPFFLLLLAGVWTWTRWASGERAAAFAVVLAAATPQLLAHAGFATTDLPVAGTLVWALYAFARWIERPRPGWRWSVLLGLAGAAAATSKLSALPYFAAAAVLMVLARWLAGAGDGGDVAHEHDTDAPATRRVLPRLPRIDLRALGGHVAPGAAAAVVAALAIWGVYRFHLVIARGVIPVPAPELLSGIRQLAEHNRNGHPAFLLGDVSERGWWYYSIVVLALKTPLPLLSLAVAAAAWAARAARRGAGWRPLAPLAGVVGVLLVGMSANIDIGVRHLLPVYPLIAIAAAAAVAALWNAVPRRGATRAAIVALAAWQVVGTARDYPDFLASFNALAGGRPARLLLDSNLDWGQDLHPLADTLAARHVSAVTLFYFGTTPVGAMRLVDTVRLGGPAPATGWVAASRTYVAGVYLPCFTWLARQRPVARIGRSMLLYHILPDSAPRLPAGTRTVIDDDESFGPVLGQQLVHGGLCDETRALVGGPRALRPHAALLARARGARAGGGEDGDEARDASVAARPAPPRITDHALLAAARGTDWLTYGHDWSGRRYSELARIDTATVRHLGVAWVHQLEGQPGGQETTPVVAGGVMYYTGPFGSVVAVDARTGEEIWRYQWKLPPVPTCCGAKNRGVAVYGDKVYVATLDDHLLALDARTGRLAWDATVIEPDDGYSITMAPLAADGKIIVGASGSEFAIRGLVDAYDAATGKRLWRFWTVPSPVEGGWWGKWSRTTPDGDVLPRDIEREKRDSARWADAWRTGGGGVWNTPSYDPELGLIYFGVGNPAPNMDGSVRPGDNLYTSSIVALDVRTGKIRWYYQEVPHDEWDYDATSPTLLLDVTVNGERVPAVAQAGKVGWVYILDRRTGARIRRTDEFVPHENTFAAPTPDGVRIMPGMGGGSNFAPASYSPKTGLMYVSGIVEPILFVLSPEPLAKGVKWQGGRHVPLGPAHGTFTAIDVTTGAVAWQTQTSERMLGTGSLATAGGLVFYGEQQGVLHAADARTGAVLWSMRVGGQVRAPPITYAVDGRQYVAIATSGALFAFTLPEESARR
ncbi:MAG TPA: PQQ-binding-like beta-propeller repeat protein [Gemmatimonadaceae bacterium]|nr:PQQ-binding-like beta-propeller repeat protein [Gemmatimonadaceae bacterium]